MYQAANVQFPSLGFYPGFASLAQEPPNEWRGRVTPLKAGNVLDLQSDSAAQFVGTGGLGSIDFSSVSSALGSTLDIGGYSLPVVAIGAGVLVLALVFGTSGRASSATRKARRLARLKGEVAAASI